MTRFDGTVKESYPCRARPEVVRAHFLDLAAIARATEGVERTEPAGEGRMRFVLAAQSHGPYKFQPDYTVWYRAEGDEVVWTTLSGNLGNSGRARFSEDGDGTLVRIEQTITIDLPVPALAAGLVRPIVDRALAPGVRDWHQRMLASVPGA